MCAEILGLSDRRRQRRGHVLHDVQAAPGGGVPRRGLHHGALRDHGRRRGLRHGCQDHLGIGNDETTEDGKITLEHVECNAACDFAPGDDGQLGVLRQYHTASGRSSWLTSYGAGRGAIHPWRSGAAPGRRPSGCLLVFPTAGPTRGLRQSVRSLLGLRIAQQLAGLPQSPSAPGPTRRGGAVSSPSTGSGRSSSGSGRSPSGAGHGY